MLIAMTITAITSSVIASVVTEVVSVLTCVITAIVNMSHDKVGYKETAADKGRHKKSLTQNALWKHNQRSSFSATVHAVIFY
jgi:hypothetical protein